MKYVLESIDSEKIYGPFTDVRKMMRWAKTQNFNKGVRIIPLHTVTVPRKKPRRKRK